ncbi:MAG: EAL domain-containing protein [Kofleriaceae bacterium]|nr:EAL domain-containing protein [Kofleriaceae bacterium]MCL4225660.1 EAL domain-containing protein [Myxococcales bacterium]
MSDPDRAAGGADRVDELARLERAFDRAVTGGAIWMAFQPIVHASQRALFGYEALMRSRDPDLPHVGALLDAAERLERTTQLGRLARAQVATEFGQAPAERGLVFVNLHARDLFDPTLTSPFSGLTRIARRVVLEITERTSLEGIDGLADRVAELREVGYAIAIDDLGGGHARMGHLTPLDTDFVKLDMALVRDLDSHPVKQRLVQSVVSLCRESGVRVIGEGVETQAEADALRDLGCDYLQGYLIARPGPPFVDPV